MIVVLGCGPAGLMAVHALRMSTDEEVVIFSRKRKSHLFGCQYLHEPIPHVTPETPKYVKYNLEGTPDGYRRKVYGPMWDGKVSPEDLMQEHLAWDLRATYDKLWDMYSEYILETWIDPAFVRWLQDEHHPTLVINSIPRDMLCFNETHHFGFTEIIAAGDAPELGVDVNKQYQTQDESVVCNGMDEPFWYRKARVFGHTTVEWPSSVGMVPVNSSARVRKPTSTDCDCLPELFHVGRYGRWEKGVLSHTAYFDTVNKLAGVKA